MGKGVVNRYGILCKIAVAPLVGAWIEMLARGKAMEKILSRSPCGSVD